MSASARLSAARAQSVKRATASAHMLRTAIAIHAAYTSPGEAALAAAEAVAILSEKERGERRRA